MEDTRWYKKAWRRAVLDMHISDLDPSFLSQYDPEEYVARLRKAGVGSAVVYAHSHAGFALYPSAVAPPHPGLGERDLFGQTAAACHRAGIGVAAYMSLIFDVAAYRSHPDWRIIRVDGREAAHDNRYGVCCPNSPYRDYAPEIARELCARYEFEGVRFDMTFWPHVCYCRYCRQRFDREVGGDLPQVVDWNDERWVAFQRCRERWLAEFAALATAAVRETKSTASVEHQASTYIASWKLAVTDLLAPHQDFMQGDFYGDSLQGSIARKLLSNLASDGPVGFETSAALDLTDYTVLKSEELLEAKAHAAIGDGAAFIFIDSVDPVGTINPLGYDRVGRISARTRAYDPYLGGERAEDVAVYLSFASRQDPADNGRRIDDPLLSDRMPHIDALTQTARTLIEQHVPWGIATRRNLAGLSRWRAIILPGVLAMDEQEADALREYVAAGGALYASGSASLVGADGRRRSDFLLADVFGVSWRGETIERYSYMAPTEAGQEFLADYTAAHPIAIRSAQAIVEARPGTEILATITLPWSDPADPTRFASIHNNPPGEATAHPALVAHRYGKGTVIWAAGPIEAAPYSGDAMAAIVRRLTEPFSVEADAPRPVEVTTFRQTGGRVTVSLLNFQRDLPPIPVDGIRVRVRAESRPSAVSLVPERTPLAFSYAEGVVSFTLPRLELFAMVAID